MSSALGDVGGGWLEGQPCHWPAGPQGLLVPVPGPEGPAPAEAVRPGGCLVWAHLRSPKSRARDNQSLQFLQKQISPGQLLVPLLG